jgi:hypothetical protein
MHQRPESPAHPATPTDRQDPNGRGGDWRRSRRWLVFTGALAALGLAMPPASAQGRPALDVLVTVDSQPIADVVVRVRSGYLASGELAAPTDGDGRVSFELPATGFYDLIVEANEFMPALATDIRVSEDTLARVTIELIRRVTGSGSY